MEGWGVTLTVEKPKQLIVEKLVAELFVHHKSHRD